MPALKDLTGLKFGRLTVRSRNDGGQVKPYWNCQCDCGQVTVAGSYALTAGVTRSCGCLQRETLSRLRTTHGKAKSPEYATWIAMKNRCLNPSATDYPKYGGAGVSIDPSWIESFEMFYSDMGKKPTRAHTIDRIDGSRGYSKDNCRWATRLEQAQNLQTNRILNYQGEDLVLQVLARRTGISEATLRYRMDVLGLTVEEAVNKPSRYGTPRGKANG